ncbi:hypothetical protein ATI53_104140 [Salipiger aestuarii]|uniref:Uncharacterized protein n=1 Tax=Salipiger aestuarii TaxID=568098 RepID=A0A327XXZ1_9RHOB|nr:hypothetical protein [Salipiger aestuarii]RAK12806.1 hypothetical protein ATI53_104140 [Salipiger aestuarii]
MTATDAITRDVAAFDARDSGAMPVCLDGDVVRHVTASQRRVGVVRLSLPV